VGVKLISPKNKKEQTHILVLPQLILDLRLWIHSSLFQLEMSQSMVRICLKQSIVTKSTHVFFKIQIQIVFKKNEALSNGVSSGDLFNNNKKF
jgi:hypothetical protein